MRQVTLGAVSDIYCINLEGWRLVLLCIPQRYKLNAMQVNTRIPFADIHIISCERPKNAISRCV